MSKRGAKLYLEDIKNAIAKIEHYAHGLTFNEFRKDDKTIDAIRRSLEKDIALGHLRDKNRNRAMSGSYLFLLKKRRAVSIALATHFDS